MPSEHETTCSPFPHVGEGQRMPTSCLIIASTFTPERRARDMSLLVASICE